MAPALGLKDLCQTLKLPTVAREAERLAEAAQRQGQGPLVYLQQVLELEVAERAAHRAARRLKEAGFPLPKTLASFDSGVPRHCRKSSSGNWLRATTSIGRKR